MKKILKTLASLAIASCLIVSFTTSAATETGEIPYKSYTYWVDYNTSEKTAVYSKPMYEVARVLYAEDIGATADSKLMDAETDNDGNTYILDSGLSKVYILNSEYKTVSVLENLIYEEENITFVDAKGIFVDNNGLIYIADTENARVIVMDNKGNIEKMLLLPESELIPTGFEYRPVKVAVDSKGYTYIASDGSYYGAILYSPDMEFLGFFGANTVKADVLDVLQNLWQRLTSNDIKRAADKISLPYTFTDIAVGPNDFIYTATGKVNDTATQTGQIAMLNPGGKDVLGASDINFADIAVSQIEKQDLSRLTVDKDGFIYALDATYGRIFWYDSGCSLLSVFGGSYKSKGVQEGTFTTATSVSVNGEDILVTDSSKVSLTVFGMTDYGRLVKKAQLITLSGDFAAAQNMWEQVIAQDVNNQLAYRGLAKAYYDTGKNNEAMKYAKMGVDRKTYAKAFEVKRTEVIEKNFYIIFLALAVIVAALIVIRMQLRKKGVVIIGNSKLKNALSSVAHPAESFRLVKEKGEGSLLISTVILLLLYVITVLNDTMGGFAFTVFDSEKYNAFYVFLSTVGLVILWSVSNWLVCTLAGGIGRIKEIFIVTCYSLLPIIFALVCKLLLTHLLTPDEGAFLGIFVTVCTLYAAFMLIVGIMRVHDYEFGKFLGTTIFTVIAILIIIFLIFLVFLLVQQIYAWFETLYIELRYR